MTKLRPEISKFADEMESTFSQHIISKSDIWKKMLLAELYNLLYKQFGELVETRDSTACVDLANVCMMIYIRQEQA